MGSYFSTFLDRYYIDSKAIISTLKRYNWYDLIENRIQKISELKTPDYSTLVGTMIQPINDCLRSIDDKQEKDSVVEILGELFRNLLADFCTNKPGFYTDLPELIEKIKFLYELNGDNFDELDELIGFNRFLFNVQNSTPLQRENRTLYLSWSNTSLPFEIFCECLVEFDLIESSERFKELFIAKNDRCITIKKKNRKRLTLILGHFFQENLIVPIGGKATFAFIEDHSILDDGQKLTKGYMKRTYNNTVNNMVGYGKFEQFRNHFLSELDQKSRL